jgi:DnaJ-class molecular chaperone
MTRICEACSGKGRLILYSWRAIPKPVGDVICQQCMGTGKTKVEK